MSFQVVIGSLGGTVMFQVGLCTPLRTMNAFLINTKWVPAKVYSLSRLPFDLGMLIEYSQLTHICDGHYLGDPVDRR